MLKINKYLDGLGVKNIGWFEFLFAIYPIITGYVVAGVPLYLAWLLMLDIFAFNQVNKKEFACFKHYKRLYVYVMLHHAIWIIFISMSSLALNIWIGLIVTMTSLLLISPVVRYEKLKGALYIVGIVCVIGLFYHVAQILAGNIITTISLPFFSVPQDDSTRLLEEGIRPKSFFGEPAAYVLFMLVPLYLSIIEKRILFIIIIVVSILLSTSTTGIAASFLMILVFVSSQKTSNWNKLLVVLLSLVFVFLICNDKLFEATFYKLNNTDLSTNERTSVGFEIARQLNAADYIFGIPYENISQMIREHKLDTSNLFLIGDKGDQVFIPTFWGILFGYGLIGLFLYLQVLWKMFGNVKELRPFLSVIIVILFSSSVSLGGIYVFQMVFMYAVKKHFMLRNHILYK